MNIGKVDTWNADVDGAAFQVQALSSNPVSGTQEVIVVFRRTVTGDDMNFMAAPKPRVDQIKILKGFDVNRILLVCMVAAQNPV